jgi:hypothetical protein
MQEREDISNYLVHFIKGDSYEETFGTLSSVVLGSQLLGGNGFIKGSSRCVCFSEAPIKALGQMLMKPSIHGVKYKPFGVILTKKWLFEQGGRPVIYETVASIVTSSRTCVGATFATSRILSQQLTSLGRGSGEYELTRYPSTLTLPGWSCLQ